MTAFFRARLADGRELIGPVQGNAGMVADGLPLDRQAWGAETVMVQAQSQARYEGRSVLPCTEFGCVTMYPQYSAASDGPPEIVPILGTRWSVYEVRP